MTSVVREMTDTHLKPCLIKEGFPTFKKMMAFEKLLVDAEIDGLVFFPLQVNVSFKKALSVPG